MAKIFSSVLFKNSVAGFFLKKSVNRSFHVSSLSMLKVGNSIPSVDLYEGDPGTVVNTEDLCKNKKIVLFGLPGAFTPGCSKTHLPGFVEKSSEIKKVGVDEIACVSVNDVFVMSAWGKVHNASGKVRMLADPNGEFTKLLGLDINIPKLGGLRSKRYAMVIDNGIIKHLNVEPDGTGLTCSLAHNLPILK